MRALYHPYNQFAAFLCPWAIPSPTMSYTLILYDIRETQTLMYFHWIINVYNSIFKGWKMILCHKISVRNLKMIYVILKFWNWAKIQVNYFGHLHRNFFLLLQNESWQNIQEIWRTIFMNPLHTYRCKYVNTVSYRFRCHQILMQCRFSRNKWMIKPLLHFFVSRMHRNYGTNWKFSHIRH